MPNYRRICVGGASYFFTVALADRSSSLLTDEVGRVRNAFSVARRSRPYVMDAVVVLPDHIHCIWTLPGSDADFADRWAHLKTVFSRSVALRPQRGASLARKRERGIWQRRYWEHLIRDDEDYLRHIDYIHYNPVRHGWVASPGDWRHSSFRRFVLAGAYTASWGQAQPPGNLANISAGERRGVTSP